MENQRSRIISPKLQDGAIYSQEKQEKTKKTRRGGSGRKKRIPSIETSPFSPTNNINMVGMRGKEMGKPQVSDFQIPVTQIPAYQTVVCPSAYTVHNVAPVPVPLMSVNFSPNLGILPHYSIPIASTSNGIFSHYPTSLPSTSHASLSPNLNVPKINENIIKYPNKKNSNLKVKETANQSQHPSKIKENGNDSPKSTKLQLTATSCSVNCFNHKKRRSNNIWRAPPNKLDGMIFVNSQLPEKNDLSLDFHFDIEAVLNPLSGFFIRKRSSCKNIQLKTFGSNFPVVFCSNFVIQMLDNSIEILNDKMDKLCVNKSLDMSIGELLINKETDNRKTSSSSKATGVINKKKKREISNIKAESLSNEVKTKNKKPKKIQLRMKIKTRNKFNSYSEYMNEEDIEKGLSEGSLIKGFIRINPRNNRDAYVTSIIKGDTDYFIRSVEDQNRALDGDEVVLKLKPKEEWNEGRKTAVVVSVSKMVHSRTAVGKLVPLRKNENFAAFYPRDKRIPLIHIPTISWPPGFQAQPESFAKTLFVTKITEWTNPENAKGLIIENIGQSGDLKIESLAILKTFGLDHPPFGIDLLKDLPRLDGLQDSWIDNREDLRTECIFTIDPLTARDLDDAVSCKVLPDGNFEVGVHIADVSFYLREGSELDKQVAIKATTVYMVDNVYHMLPVEICMGCSLLPGKDKLSFSVFWKMTPDGQILDTRFGRTVMNSCTQLAYEHAQMIIDNPDDFDRTKFPPILNGYTIEDIRDVVLRLYNISKNLRGDRFENGALRIDQIKLSFDLDPVTGYPLRYYCQEMKEANRLIEEFMLLANISVAEKIRETFPEIAFLRLHEPPKETMLKELKKGLESVGIHVDTSSAKSVQSSLLKYGSNDLPGRIRAVVLSHLFAKPMTRARYFCPGTEKDPESYGHYALNIPLYTHFTSPIRRYADVMVHRLLEASLGLAEAPKWDPSFVSDIAERCNVMKYNAKKAQEDSTKLYLSLYIDKHGPFVRDAAVVDVKEKTFDVLVLECGEVVRIYLNETEGVKFEVEEVPNPNINPEDANENQKKSWRIQILFLPSSSHSASEIIIELFTLVKVELKKCPKKKKLTAKLLRPNA